MRSVDGRRAGVLARVVRRAARQEAPRIQPRGPCRPCARARAVVEAAAAKIAKAAQGPRIARVKRPAHVSAVRMALRQGGLEQLQGRAFVFTWH